MRAQERSNESPRACPPIPTSNLRKIISASPAVASLLPGVMRTLADEIEREAHAVPRFHAVSGPPHPDAAEQLETMTYRVVTDLSMTLSQHLARSLHARASGSASQYLSTERPREPEEPGARHVDTPDGEPAPRRQLRLKLLGTPEIILDGVRLKALERCSRAALVIYILALHPRGLSAERLAAYIASDSADVDAFDTDAAVALGTIRTFVWRLRKLSGWRDVVVSPEEQGGCQNRYRLPEDTTCDLWEFERNLDEAARLAVRASIEPDAADRAAVLRQDAIVLYGGEFCKGIGSGSISRAADYLHNRYLQAVMLQAAYWKEKAMKMREMREDAGNAGNAGSRPAEEEKAWLEALSNYRLAAQIEPYEEAAYVGAMLCQAHLGNGKGVQETFARCSRVINSELDRTPFATTVRATRESLELAMTSTASIWPAEDHAQA